MQSFSLCDYPYVLGRDFHHLIGGLYQGSMPPTGLRGFDVIVFCAMEHQPLDGQYAHIIHAPNDDSGKPMSELEILTAEKAAREVVMWVRNKRRVLVTCMQGRNRSGLVSALAIRKLLRCSGTEAMKIVKNKRPRSLQNPFFERYLERKR